MKGGGAALAKAEAQAIIAQVTVASAAAIGKEIRQAYADGASQGRLALDSATDTIVKLNGVIQTLHRDIGDCFDRLGKVAELSANREIFLAEKEILIKRLETENKRAERIIDVFKPVVKELSERMLDRTVPEKVRNGKKALEALFAKLLSPEHQGTKSAIETLAGPQDWADIMTMVEALTT